MTRDTYEMKPKLSRGSSLFGSDPQVQLRTALLTNDFATFKKLVSYGTVDLEHVYQYPDYKTCLEIAVSEPNKHDFVKHLLQHEVEVNKVNETQAMAPIHFAVENANIEALRLLLEDDRIDVNIKSKGNTALLMAIKQIEDLDDDRERDLAIYEDMVELLLKAGCNANSPDSKGVTPVHSAAKQGLERVVTLILDYSKEPVHLDSYKDIRGNTARYYLEQAFPHLLAKFDAQKVEPEEINVDKLFSYISREEEDDFISHFTKVKNNELRTALAANNGSGTMLQLATKSGMHKAVKTLLLSGADPNATCSCNTTRPIGIACQYGHYKILKMFVDNESTLFDPVNGESLVQITVKGMRSYSKAPKEESFNACLQLLLKHPKVNININHSDMKYNTALHYAARNGDQDTVLELLRNGACVGLRNKFNEPPLADINAKTLETYLDECVTTNNQRASDDDYEIHMKYSFLVYPNNSLENELCKVPLMDNSSTNDKELDSILAPETDALLYMTTNEDLRPLLKHPVITSFLYLKWQRISCLFYANITFYSLFSLCLILYIMLGYGVEKKQSKLIEALNVITHIGAIIGLIVLIFRELFQLLVAPTRYLQSLENWMEIILIFVTALVVGNDSAAESTKQQLSSVAILLSSAELVMLIGHFPTLSTNIVMLKTVSWNFFKFLLWYCILIIAFALSFYTLFRHEQEDEDQKAPNPNSTGKEEEEEEDFFEDPGRSLFKTIVMLTGEFDAGSIKFSTFPVTSHFIFIVFVFMIPIVLFNLLNGLAVSDTQEIRANAQLVGHISQVKLISYFESVLIGSAKSYGKPSTCWSWMPTCFENLNIIKPKMFCMKPFAKRISLFPQFLPKYRIIVKPNQDNKIEIPHAEPLKYGDDYEDIEGGAGGCCFERCQNYRLDAKIVKNAKLVVSKKTHITEFDEIKNQLSKYERKIEDLELKIKKVLQAVESSHKY